jgi:hypothetical protein
MNLQKGKGNYISHSNNIAFKHDINIISYINEEDHINYRLLQYGRHMKIRSFLSICVALKRAVNVAFSTKRI